MSIIGNVAVPPSWTIHRFGHVAPRVQLSGRPDLAPLSVFLDAGVVPRSSREDNHNQLGEDLSKYLVVQPGDIVFNKLRTWQGGLGVSRFEGIVSPAYFVCRPALEYDPRYLHYLLRSQPYLQELTRISKWMPPSQFDIGWEQLRLLPVMTPPLANQRAVADYLDTETARIDSLIAKKRQIIKLVEDRWRSECARSVLHDLNPITGAGRVPDGWDIVRLGVLLALHRGFDLPTDTRIDGPIPVISSGGISGRHSEKACDGPGVVTGRYGTIGDAFFVEGPYWPLNTTLFVSEFRGNHPKWVYYLLSTMPLDIDSAKSAVTGINRNVIGTLRAPKPPLEAQRYIAKHLDASHHAVHRLLDRIHHQIHLLIEHRQALITAAVTGVLEVVKVAA